MFSGNDIRKKKKKKERSLLPAPDLTLVSIKSVPAIAEKVIGAELAGTEARDEARGTTVRRLIGGSWDLKFLQF